MGAWIPNNPAAEFLKIPLVKAKYFLFDYWTFIHIFSGGLIAWVFSLIPNQTFQQYSWLVAMFVIVGYEIVEIIGRGKAFGFETRVNIVWDIIFTFAGYAITKRFLL